MATLTVPTDAEILERVFTSSDAPLTPAAAKQIMSLGFDRPTIKYISKLMSRNSRGTITVEERISLDRYLRVARIIDLLHANALASMADGERE